MTNRRQQEPARALMPVVVSTDEFDRLRSVSVSPKLHELLSRSPLNRVEFEREPIHGPVREVDI